VRAQYCIQNVQCHTFVLQSMRIEFMEVRLHITTKNAACKDTYCKVTLTYSRYYNFMCNCIHLEIIIQLITICVGFL
jgi:hypothetical protein